MKKPVFKTLFRRWFTLPLVAVLLFLLTFVFSKNPFLTETVYSQRIYPVFAAVISFISSAFPFSLDDFFYLSIVLSAGLSLVFIIFQKKQRKRAAKILVNLVAGFYILFYLFWGFNYYRPGLNARLQLQESKPDTEEFNRILSLLVERVNTNYTTFDHFSVAETDSLVEAGYRQYADILKINYPNGKRRPKPITFSRTFARAGISGYFGPFFNEIHMNRLVLPVEYPFVLAHEKAHQFGVTSEAEANFLAWLVCSRSSSEKLRYSAYIQALQSFLYQGSMAGIKPDALSHLDKRAKADFLEIYNHWKELRNERIDKATSKVYDTYLKANKVEQGIDDYYGMVKFIMDFSLDSDFNQKVDANRR
jgi:hypothetical protein